MLKYNLFVTVENNMLFTEWLTELYIWKLFEKLLDILLFIIA